MPVKADHIHMRHTTLLVFLVVQLRAHLAPRPVQGYARHLAGTIVNCYDNGAICGYAVYDLMAAFMVWVQGNVLACKALRVELLAVWSCQYTLWRPLLQPLGVSLCFHSLCELFSKYLRMTFMLHERCSRKSSMSVQKMLEDIPDAAFEAVLNHLEAEDVASLRLVSHSISKRTTQNTPYITLKLSAHSSGWQLDQWDQATRRFQHVTSVHVRISCARWFKLSAQVFELAMQLLSERKSITELHLLADDDDDGAWSDIPAAWIPTLMPLKHIIAQLHTLVLQDVTCDITHELLQLMAEAPATGWQLQSLTLHADWSFHRHAHWLEFTSMLKRLATTAFPKLRKFSFQFPLLLNIMGTARGDFVRRPPSAVSESDAGVMHLQEPAYSFFEHWHAQLVGVALVTALSNAVVELRSLEVLTVVDLPDIWKTTAECSYPYRSPEETVSTAVAMAAKSSNPAAAIVNAALTEGQLPSVAMAAAAFTTMEAYGCWLLQHSLGLRQVKLNTATFEESHQRWSEVDWQMSWQRQQMPCHWPLHSGNSCDRSSAAAEAEVTAIDPTVRWSVDVATYSAEWRPANHSSKHIPLLHSFTSHASQYSFRPVSAVLSQIVRMRLELGHSVDGLTGLLSGCQALKHLEVSLLWPDKYPEDTMPEFYPAAVISAAATVQGLEGLVVDAGHLRPPATLDLLLPLTAAAGGPGSTLKKLELKMRFTADATSAMRSPQATSDMPLAPLGQAATSASEARESHDKTSALLAAPNAIASNTCAGSAADVTPAVCRTGGAMTMHAQPSVAGHGSSDKSQLPSAGDQCPGGETPEMPKPLAVGPGWHNSLRSLEALHELVLQPGYNGQTKGLDVPVTSLPVNLRVFRGSGLNIFGSPPAVEDSASNLHQTTTNTGPQLHQLLLFGCRLSSPAILASQQMQLLSLYLCKWPGGKAAAVAAWPKAKMREVGDGV